MRYKPPINIKQRTRLVQDLLAHAISGPVEPPAAEDFSCFAVYELHDRVLHLYLESLKAELRAHLPTRILMVEDEIKRRNMLKQFTRVEHETFGQGTVLSSASDGVVRVFFDDEGEKTVTIFGLEEVCA